MKISERGSDKAEAYKHELWMVFDKMYSQITLLLVLLSAAIRAEDAAWWKSAVIYQIYPLSFRDSDNNGSGDFKGITEKLIHVKNAGADAIWMSPIFKSPMVDGGYDISSFTSVNELFGTEDDLNDLVAEAKRLGLKVILDFVPNHTSDQHNWFKRSAEGDTEFKDFYVWIDCKLDEHGNVIPPNNWKSAFGGSAWSYHPTRKQCYLHKFAEKQIDLNYRNTEVQRNMEDVLRFWLDRGFDGFRVDAVPHLVEDMQLRDEPKKDPSSPDESYDSLLHIYTENLPETYETVFAWRKVLDEYKEKDGYERVLITESYGTLESITAYYGDSTHPGASFSFNFAFLVGTRKNSTATEFKTIIDDWQKAMGTDRTSNWVLGNHDNWRIASKYGKEKIDGLNMLIMTLPGVAISYNGEEIGMENGEVSWEQTKDPQALNAGPDHYREVTRDFERTPFHWDESPNAGFNIGGNTWLPVSDLYETNNVAVQSRAHESHLKVYQALTALRKKRPAIRSGDLTTSVLEEDVLLITRSLADNDLILVVFNMSPERKVNVRLSNIGLPPQYVVEVASVGSKHTKGSTVESYITLEAYEAVVLSG